jgi:hypothetical protein
MMLALDRIEPRRRNSPLQTGWRLREAEDSGFQPEFQIPNSKFSNRNEIFLYN